MAANVESMFYVRETPWHGLGTKVAEAPCSKEALRLSGLDWNVIQEPIHMQVLFNVLMGLRRSEINAVKYSDVDYVNRTLTVQRQLGQIINTKKEDFAPKTFTKQEIEPKTESSYRVLPIPDYVFEAILQEITCG